MPAIYRIVRDPPFQSLEPVNEETYQHYQQQGAWAFTGHRYDGDWVPIELKRAGEGASPDIWWFKNTFILEANAATELELFVEQSGMLYEMPFEERNVYPAHIMYALNCLDQRQTIWQGEGADKTIEKYAFHRGRVDWSLFKIPETHEFETLTVQGLTADDSEFKSTYEKHGFTGLQFELLDEW